jgi:hypothetical protein
MFRIDNELIFPLVVAPNQPRAPNREMFIQRQDFSTVTLKSDYRICCKTPGIDQPSVNWLIVAKVNWLIVAKTSV